GSRTTFGFPAPPSTSTHPPVRASTVARVAHVARIDHVVVLRRTGGSTVFTELEVAQAAIQLVLAARDVERFGSAALEVVAQAMGGARCTLVDYSDPHELAAVIATLPAPGARPLVVAHRFDGNDALPPEPSA